jgi:hypothetical protein
MEDRDMKIDMTETPLFLTLPAVKLLWRIPYIFALLLLSCLQPVNQQPNLEYVPEGAHEVSAAFRAENGSDMIILSFEGGAFQTNLTNSFFELSGPASFLYRPVRDNDTQVIFPFDSSGPHSLPAGEYRITVKAGAFQKTPSRVMALAVSSAADWKPVEDPKFGSFAIRALSHGSAKYLAGGGGGKLAYSRDSLSWTPIPPGFTAAQSNFPDSEQVLGIAYGNGTFYAAGTGGRVSFSGDGLSWNGYTESIFGGNSINAIVYGGGKFLAAGNSGRMMYMQDGDNWTAVSGDASKFGAININALAWGQDAGGGNMYVAGGDDPGGGAGGQLCYSRDGVNWNYRGGGAAANANINALAFGKSSGAQGIFTAGFENGSLHYSTDGGQNWAAASQNGGLNFSRVQSLACGCGVFIALGIDSNAVAADRKLIAASSADGKNWDILTFSGNPPPPFTRDFDLGRAVYAGGKFIVAGTRKEGSGAAVMVSRYYKPEREAPVP